MEEIKKSEPFCILVKNTSEEAQEVNLFDLASNSKDIIVKSAHKDVTYEEFIELLKVSSFKIAHTMIISYDGDLIEKVIPIGKCQIEFSLKDASGTPHKKISNIILDPYQTLTDRTMNNTEYTLNRYANIKFHLNGWKRVILYCYPSEKVAN